MEKDQRGRKLPDGDLPAHDEPILSGDETRGIDIDVESLDAGKKDDKGKDRSSRQGGEDRDDELAEDREGALESADTDVDAKRERRRQERKDRRDARDRRESELRARVEASEAELARIRQSQERGVAVDAERRVREIDAERERLRSVYADSKKLKEEAYTKADGKTAVEADEAMLSARQSFDRLGDERDRVVYEFQQGQNNRQRVDPGLASNAKSFMEEHDWYDPKASDKDSRKVLQLDRALAAEGWDPRTKAYWNELRERVKEELPHKFDEEDDGERDNRNRDRDEERDTERRPQRRVTTGGGDRDRGGGGGGRTFHLSAQRIAALKEAGMWDDVAQRNKMIKTYIARDEADRRNKGR